MDTIWTAGVRRGGVDAGADGRREGGRARGRARRPDARRSRGRTRSTASRTNTNVQLLWYRKDLVPKPPETWDEMIAMAKQIRAHRGQHPRAGTEVRGLHRLVQQPRRLGRRRRSSTPRAARRSTTRRSRPRRSSRMSPPAASPIRRCRRRRRTVAARVRGRQGRLPAQLALRLRRRSRDAGKTNPVTKKVFENMGYARWPGVNKGEPSKVSIGGANLGIPNSGRNPELATAGRAVHDEREVAGPGGHQRRPAAGHELDLRRPQGPRGLPVRRPAARAAQGLGRAPADAVLLGRDAGDPGLAASAGGHRSAAARSTRCGDRLNTLADGGMY